MPDPDETQEQIRLLKSQGRVTHIVAPAGDLELSSSALVRRCISAELDHPVALPDGTVAVFAPDGLPPTLEALQVTVLAVAQVSGEAASRRSSDADRLVAIDSALRDLEARISGDLSFVRSRAEWAAKPAPPAGEDAPPAPRDVDSALADAAPKSTDLAEDSPFSEAEDTTDPLVLHQISTPENTTLLTVEPTEEDCDHAPDAPDAPDAPGEEGQDVLDPPNEMAPDGDTADPLGTNAMAPDEHIEEGQLDPVPDTPDPDLSAALTFLPAGEPAQEMVAPERPDAIAPTTPDLGPERDDANSAAWVDAEKLDSLMSVVERQGQALEAVVARLETLADQPAPRPDMAQANRYFARFATAFAKAVARLEAASDRLEALPDRDSGSALGEGIAAVREELSHLVSALAHRSASDDAADIAQLIALQEVVVRQMAAVLDAQSSGQEPPLSEFLTDLRHTIAEIIAEQKRAAIAS